MTRGRMTLGVPGAHTVDIRSSVHSKGGRCTVAQMVSRGGPRMTPVSVVTVADLLSRNPPAAGQLAGADAPTPGISVGSLLRREGRAPHALDRPVQARAHQPAAQQATEQADEEADGQADARDRGRAPQRAAARAT